MSWCILAGLGLSTASLTAYRDLTEGVKSTFFAESVVLALLGRLGVLARLELSCDCSSCGREGRRIDLRPAKVGSLEPMLFVLVAEAGAFVDCDRCSEKTLLLELNSNCAVGSGGRGLPSMALSDRGIFEADGEMILLGLDGIVRVS